MSGLIRMRLSAYVRTQVALAPLLCTLAVLGVFYGGGQAEPAEAYGVSAVILFPIFAWQAKILLDVEPDGQRHIAITAMGSRGRELAAGLIAAFATTSVTLVLGMCLPWILGGVKATDTEVPLLTSLASGLWLHLNALPPALAVGALASRTITRSAGTSALILTGGTVLAIVVGLKQSPLPWLAPPLMPAAREAVQGATASGVLTLTLWSLTWATLTLAAYTHLRRTRP